MKFMTAWITQPGVTRETVGRFLAGQGQPPQGVKLLGRWHKADMSGGWALIETDSAAAAFEYSAMWSDLLGLQTTPVVEDADGGPVLARVFKTS
jgi:hypothetical protein